MFRNMPLCPFKMLSMRQNIRSYFRLLHASPDTPAVDVYLNNNLYAKNLRYKEFTKYFLIVPGVYNIKVFPVNQSTNPLINTNLNIALGTIATFAVAGYRNSPFIEVVGEPIQPILPYRAYVRFVHLSPNTPAVDVRLAVGRRLFTNVQYREIEQYVAIDPGKYTLQLLNSQTGQLVLTVPNANFRPGRYYTVYAVGLEGAQPPLQVLIPLDGNSYLKVR